ncbi:MAG TPA: prephenate dehydratase [Desulfitobacterium dehalogenans]|uniref:Prephenate dehydratase n=1 Tax=Desulfitobacterium dehalogenans TaxID=36854 RepID=A0A7C6Z6C2_9FIRM|nr:prephenate dehydratase [Desulfitobacterium dehalogenans]
MNIGYLGPKGSFSEEALQLFLTTQSDLLEPPLTLVPFTTIPKLLTACQDLEIEGAFVPLENSTEGQVGVTMDMLGQTESLYIMREFIFPVDQCLITANPLDLGQIEQIFSHEQALGQCRDFLEAHLPQAEQLPCPSTAEAVMKIANNPGKHWAALGPRRAAEIYNLHCEAERIQDSMLNATRFIFVGHHLAEMNEEDKTSLLVITGDTPGALANALQEFALRNINLSRIESRPSKKKLGEYVFFVDIDGYVFSPSLQEALWALKDKGVSTKLLGSYPKAQPFAKE